MNFVHYILVNFYLVFEWNFVMNFLNFFVIFQFFQIKYYFHFILNLFHQICIHLYFLKYFYYHFNSQKENFMNFLWFEVNLDFFKDFYYHFYFLYFPFLPIFYFFDYFSIIFLCFEPKDRWIHHRDHVWCKKFLRGYLNYPLRKLWFRRFHFRHPGLLWRWVFLIFFQKKISKNLGFPIRNFRWNIETWKNIAVIKIKNSIFLFFNYFAKKLIVKKKMIFFI